MYGNDYRYAATRLDDTIARLMDGTPVYIQHVNVDGSVVYFDVEGLMRGDGPKATKLENINAEPVSLGYMNAKTGCTYLSRVPVRRWKQGLRLNENCTSSNGGLNQPDYEALAKTIRGQYPKFSEVVKATGKVNNPFKGVKNSLMKAWHRFWAYDAGTSEVHYRGEVVGKVVDGHVNLNPSFKYLQECLMESV